MLSFNHHDDEFREYYTAIFYIQKLSDDIWYLIISYTSPLIWIFYRLVMSEKFMKQFGSD